MWGKNDFDRFRRGGESESAGHGSGRTEAALAIETEMTARFGIFADASIRPRIARIFDAEDGADSEGFLNRFMRVAVVATQLLADESEKPVMGCEGEVVGAHGGGIALAAGSTRDDQREVAVAAGGDEKGFQRRVVNPIDDDVVSGVQQARGIRGGKERGHFDNFDLGMDEPESLREDGDFQPAEGPGEGGELAIAVRHADLVGIDEGDAADAASGKRLGRPRADPARADDRDMGAAESFESVGPVETAQTGKAVEKVVGKFLVQAAHLALEAGALQVVG